MKFFTIKTIVLVGFLLRFGLYLYAFAHPEIIYDGDSKEYWALAVNFVEKHELDAASDRPFPPGSVRPPVYPLFLAAVIAVRSPSPLSSLLLQVVLSTFNIYLVYRLALRLGFKPHRARVAALLLALDISSIIYATSLMSETVFTTLLLLSFFVLIDLQRNVSWQNVVRLGILTGLLTLTRPIAQFLLLLYSLLFFFGTKLRVRRRLLYVGAYLSLTALLLLPWIWRNAERYGFAGISTVSAFNLLYYNGALAYAHDAQLGIDEAEDRLTAELSRRVDPATASVGAYAAAMQKLGIETVLAHFSTAVRQQMQGIVALLVDPGRINLARVLRHPGGPGLLEAIATKGLGAGLLMVLGQQPALTFWFIVALGWQVALCGFFIVGIIFSWRHLPRQNFWALVFLIGYFLIFTGPIGAARFRVPITPFLVIFAAAGVSVFRKQ